MKIINVENNKKVVYVQKKDLLEMLKNGYSLNTTLEDSFSDNFMANFIKFMDDSNPRKISYNSFIRISNSEDVKKIIDIDWIINFKDFYNLSNQELIKYLNEFINYSQNFKEKMKKCPNRRAKKNLLNKYKTTMYIIKTVKEILQYKKLQLELDLPQAPDNLAKSKLISGRKYILTPGLNPEELYMSKTNDEAFTKEDVLRENLIMNIIGKYGVQLQDQEDFITKLYLSYNISEDRKRIIISFKRVKEFEKPKAEIINFKDEIIKRNLQKTLTTLKSKMPK